MGPIILKNVIKRTNHKQISIFLVLMIRPLYFSVYRPEKHNWEYAICKFQDFSANQILREISFGLMKSAKIDFT